MSMIRCDDPNADWKERQLGLRDAIELFQGKWKFRILKTLASGSLRFKDLQEKLNISPKVLTRELQELEQNFLIARTVIKKKPVTVEYSVTEYAKEARSILEVLITFGEKHRKKIKAQMKAS